MAGRSPMWAVYSHPKRSTWRNVAVAHGRPERLLAQEDPGVGVVVVHVGGDAVAVGQDGVDLAARYASASTQSIAPNPPTQRMARTRIR